MTFRSENERNKAVVDAFYQLGIQGRLIDFAQYLDSNFTWTRTQLSPVGRHAHRCGALSRPSPFQSSRRVRFRAVQLRQCYRRGRPCRRGHQPGCEGTDAVIKIVDCWTVGDRKVTSMWVAYFEPQALLEKLGIAHGLPR